LTTPQVALNPLSLAGRSLKKELLGGFATSLKEQNSTGTGLKR